MTTIKEFNDYGSLLESSLALRSFPLAVKMLTDESQIPEGALRPKRDRGYHLAQCQAFSLSRFQGLTLAMLKEDNWCWGALFAYGLIDPALTDKFPELQNDKTVVPMLEYGKYTGVLSAPLKSASFEPDIVLIYSNTGQLRQMLHVLSFIRQGVVDSPIYPVASCALSVVPAMHGKSCITLPDPGEIGRGCAGEDEIIYSLPAGKVADLASQLKTFDDRHMGYRDHAFLEIRGDFPRPDFYKRLFRECGLDADDTAVWPEKR